jgi:hypothetical protein
METSVVSDTKLQGMLDLRSKYEIYIAEAPKHIAKLDQEIKRIKRMPETGSINEICDIMKENYQNARKRDQLVLDRVKIGATITQYRALLPDLTQAIELYVYANPDSIKPVTKTEKSEWAERIIDITPPRLEKVNPLLEDRVTLVMPPSSYREQQDSIEKPGYLQFLEYRNTYSQKWLSTIVREAGIPGITNISEGYQALRTAMSQGHMVNRYDNDLATDAMREEMVREYCTNYSKSLKTIAHELSEKYHLRVSESTIRNYARKKLGDVRRKDRSAEHRYLETIRSSPGTYYERSRHDSGACLTVAC